jgi:hypothetical protein
VPRKRENPRYYVVLATYKDKIVGRPFFASSKAIAEQERERALKEDGHLFYADFHVLPVSSPLTASELAYMQAR